MSFPSQRSALGEFVLRSRLEVAAAYRRLADEALRAAEKYAAEESPPVLTSAAEKVTGRVASVRHAQKILAATLEGASR